MTTTRSTIRSLFPGYVVGMKQETFAYLHHDADAFERRSVPCLCVNITSKEFHLDRNDRRVFHNPDPSAVVTALRGAGLCAENTIQGIVVMLVDRPNWPRNQALGLGQWHAKMTQPAPCGGG